MPPSNLAIYHRPADLESALALLREGRGRAVPLAGGTALLAAPPREVEVVVDLADLRLDWLLAREDGSLSIGATTPLAALVREEATRDYAGGLLAQAARYAAGSLVRERATVGGTLIARAALSDLAAVLLALDATVVLQNGGEHLTPLADFFRRRAYHLQPGSLLTEIRLPALPAGSRASLQRVARTPMDQPIVAVAARVQHGRGQIQAARVVANGISDSPTLLATLSDKLAGTIPGSEATQGLIAEAVAALKIKSDHLASADYRRAVLPVLVQRALAPEEP